MSVCLRESFKRVLLLIYFWLTHTCTQLPTHTHTHTLRLLVMLMKDSQVGKFNARSAWVPLPFFPKTRANINHSQVTWREKDAK